LSFRQIRKLPAGLVFKPLGDEALAQVDINLPQRPLTAIDELVGRVCRGNDDLPCPRFERRCANPISSHALLYNKHLLIRMCMQPYTLSWLHVNQDKGNVGILPVRGVDEADLSVRQPRDEERNLPLLEEVYQMESVFPSRCAGLEDKSEFIQTMVDLHSAIFGITAEQARESAELRVLAGNTVDLITSKTSTDVAADWAKLEEYLRQCYSSIQYELERVSILAGEA
jgi:hypothetical protein